MMIIICSWCKKILGYKEGDGVTHGICKECLDKLEEEINKFYQEVNIDELVSGAGCIIR